MSGTDALHIFFASEVRVWRGDPWEFLIAIGQRLQEDLEGAGIQGPFQFECVPGSFGAMAMVVSPYRKPSTPKLPKRKVARKSSRTRKSK